MSSLNVIHISSSNSWGGMEMIVGRLAYLQKQEGYNIAVAARKNSATNQNCQRLGLDTHPIFADSVFDTGGYRRLLQLVKIIVPDILHVHYSKDLNLTVPVKHFSGGKVVFTKHLGSYIKKRDPWHRFIYHGVDRTTAISRLIKNNLIETTHLKENKIDIVYLGTDTDRFKPDPGQRNAVRKEIGITEEATLIGMMGRISYGKGYEDFIEMAKALTGRDIEFLFIGGHSNNEDDYGTKIEKEIKNKLGQKAHLIGFKEDREKYLQALDVFIFPSYAESFGLALTEAMACGLPCVAYGKDGVLDIIDDGQDGLLAEVKNVDDLIAKIKILIQNEALRIKLGKAGREKVVNKFSDLQMLRGFEETYKIAMDNQ